MRGNKTITALLILCCLSFALAACTGEVTNLSNISLYQDLAGKYRYIINDKIVENNYIVLTAGGSFYDSQNNLGRYSVSNDAYCFKMNMNGTEVELFSGTINGDSIVYICYNKTYKYIRE